MTDITPSKSIDINQELGNLSQYKYHPNGILTVSLNRLKDITDGKVEISDPSNPFTYLLETSALNTAFAIQEMTLLTRKLYPKLANNEDDLYLHMSDVDYLDRFSTPSKAKVKFNILFSDFSTHAYQDPHTRDYLHTLPKNLTIKIDNYIYSLTAPIVIRLTETGVADIRYIAEERDELFELETGYIDFNLVRNDQGDTFLSFETELPEINLESVEIPLERHKLFKGNMIYSEGRQFHYLKAFHFLNGRWVEMLTTHTDQVYDITKPTCILRVNQLENKIGYYIPPVYLRNGVIGSKVKFVVYTTLGPVNVNFNEYDTNKFSVEYNEVFPELELGPSTASLNLIPKIVRIDGRVVGGSGSKSFDKLKYDVINNNLGRDHKPVTNVQIENYLDNSEFSLVRNVDVITNRIFLLEANLPRTVTRYDISNINLDIIEYMSSVNELRTGNNGIVPISDTVTLLPEGTAFEITHDGLKILSREDKDILDDLSGTLLVNELNHRRLLALYYHYVLDTSDETTVLRPYDISNPKIEKINFKGFNPTCRIGVNTTQTNLIKTDVGFQLDIMVNLKKYTELVTEVNVTPYIVHREEGGATFFLEGRLYTMMDGNPVYRFYIDSEFYIDSKNRITITNFKDSNGIIVSLSLDLESKLEILYLSNRIVQEFEASVLDEYIYGSYLVPGRAAVTLEELSFKFGYFLEHLYARVHSSTGTNDYERYDEDVVATYDSTVYGPDNQVLHNRNEDILDVEGNPVYKHRRGEIKLDSSGNPILLSRLDTQKYMNLMFVDYRALIANNDELVEHRSYLKDYLTSLIIRNVKDVQPKLLENTIAYMTVPVNLQDVLINYDGITGYIKSSQSFNITVYVSKMYFEDTEARKGIELMLKEELDNYLSSNRTLSKSVIVSRMLDKSKEYVKGINIDKFTDVGAEYIELPMEGDRLTFDKTLTMEPDGYRLSDNVTFTFVEVK